MTFQRLIGGLLLAVGVIVSQAAEPVVIAKPHDSRLDASPSPSPWTKSFKERLATALSVKVETGILGIELDSTLEQARERLDSLGSRVQPASQGPAGAEKGEGEGKTLWKLDKSDFSSILLKSDDQERVTYIMGLIRQGKEIPFAEIGDTEKAPLLTDQTAAWDVVRPDKSLIRVVARGEKSKANTITIFVVKQARQ